MARTKTKKTILKAERSGTWCSANTRRTNGDYSAISQHVRIMPSKQQQLNKMKQKERISYDGAPFLLRFLERESPLLRCGMIPRLEQACLKTR